VIHKRVVERDASLYSTTEGRIELAIQAFKKGQFQSLQAAALTYDAPIMTVDATLVAFGHDAIKLQTFFLKKKP
jgi:hypothetical protein